jgi:hypothetical protein
MNSDKFEELYFGRWYVDEREIKLIERLQKYYDDTPDEMSNIEARKHWVLFKKWADNNGYSKEEINAAKKSCKF